MQIVKKRQNNKEIYEITYDEEKVKELIELIIEENSYRSEGIYFINSEYYYPHYDKNNSELFLPNGKPLYENIKESFKLTPNCRYINATKINVPQLAYILNDILCDKQEALGEFFNYVSSDELVDLNKKIILLDDAINNLSNFDFKLKKELLTEFEIANYQLLTNQYFDAELLRQSYIDATELIFCQLVGEIDYINQKPTLVKRFYIDKKPTN